MTEVEQIKKIDLAETENARSAWQDWRRAKAQEAATKREVERTRRALDRIIGDNQRVLLAGVEVADYCNDGAFNEKKFRDELPHIAKDYLSWKAAEVFDVARFKEDNPTLFEAFRTRTLRVKDDA